MAHRGRKRAFQTDPLWGRSNGCYTELNGSHGFQTDPLWGRSLTTPSNRRRQRQVPDGPLVGSKQARQRPLRDAELGSRRTPCGVEAFSDHSIISFSRVPDGPLVGSKPGVEGFGEDFGDSSRRTPCGVEAHSGRIVHTSGSRSRRTPCGVEALQAGRKRWNSVMVPDGPLVGSKLSPTGLRGQWGGFQTDPLWGRSSHSSGGLAGFRVRSRRTPCGVEARFRSSVR